MGKLSIDDRSLLEQDNVAPNLSKDFPVKHRFSMTGRQAGFPFLPTCFFLSGAARARRIGQTDCLSLIGLDRVSPGAMRLTAPAGLHPTSAGSGRRGSAASGIDPPLG